jgi:hypothetical protein
MNDLKKEYRYIPGRGYVANIDGQEVVYDYEDLPELIERIKKSKESKPEPKEEEDDRPVSFKEFLKNNIEKYPDLAYIFDKNE